LKKRHGFTLVEVLVALIVTLLIVGSSMALFRIHLRNQERLAILERKLPILDTAAQEILRKPELADEKTIVIRDYPDSPTVLITTHLEKKLSYGELKRVRLTFDGETIEFSIIIPSVAQ